MTDTIISLEKALELREDGAILVDARSPSEFKETTIPGAVNAPILDDQQRIEIGTLYKKAGKKVALKRGIEITAPRIPGLIETVRKAKGEQHVQVVVFCWRGGLRSRALTSFLNMAGIQACQIIGGHRAFRQHLLEYFEISLWEKMVVFCGFSGVGKTRVLQRLDDEGYPVLNLEGLANNRGSAFGSLGLAQQPGQKMFEALLWDRLCRIGPDQPIITEAESRRIGQVALPLRVYEALGRGKLLWFTSSLERRTEVILDDYPPPQLHKKEFARKINTLRKRLSNKTVDHLLELLDQGQERQLVSQLLERYYDPLYRHTQPSNAIEINMDDEERALGKIKSIINQV